MNSTAAISPKPLIYGILMCIVIPFASAQSIDDRLATLTQKLEKEKTKDQKINETCQKEFANRALDPLRGKIAMYQDAITDVMLTNEAKASRFERKAFTAYINAKFNCDIYASNLVEGSNSKLGKDFKQTLNEDINPLRNGEITYAEYNRREAKILKQETDIVEGLDPNRFAKGIEAWLAPFKSSYPENSPWWGFYNFAIATAKDADIGILSEEKANKLIDDRRLKFNQELATTTPSTSAPKIVTLNCSLTWDNGARDLALTIDYTNMQVNGYKAEFYENEIRWSHQGTNGSTNYYNQLNRLSGYINIGTDEFPRLQSGKCVQATKQF